VAVENFEDQVDRLIEKMTIPEKFTKWAISWVRKLHAEEVQERTAINKNMQNFYNDIQKQIDELLDIRLKGLIENEEYQKKKGLLLLEKAEVKDKLKTTDNRADDWLDLCERTFNFATYARIWFAKGNNEQKRSILHALGSNLTLNDKILSLEQRKPFLIINGMKEKLSILMETFEPNEKIDLTSQIASSDPTTLSLLRSRDSNPNKRIHAFWRGKPVYSARGGKSAPQHTGVNCPIQPACGGSSPAKFIACIQS